MIKTHSIIQICYDGISRQHDMASSLREIILFLYEQILHLGLKWDF